MDKNIKDKDKSKNKMTESQKIKEEELKNKIKEKTKKKNKISKEKLQEKNNKTKEKLKSEKKKFNKKLFNFIILILIVLIVIAISGYYLYKYIDSKKYKPYYQYEEKMEIYGFSRMYDNESAATKEYVTISEALKLVVGATLNIDEMWSIGEETYINEKFVDYAKDNEIVTYDVNIDNYNEKVKYIDVISFVGNAKEKLLNNSKMEELTIDIKDFNDYTIQEQKCIKDLVSNEIIEIINNKVNGKNYIFKGQLNEIIVKYVEKLNLIAMEGEKLNINPEKIPSNYDYYPYTVTNIDKEVYEYPTVEKGTEEEPRTAAEIYKFKKDSYEQIEYMTEIFFNTLLNVDYRTLDKEEFKKILNKYLTLETNDERLDEYIQYIRDNEIITEGKGISLLPIFYFNGVNYRLRVKIEYNIINSKTKENLMYFDSMLFGDKVIYEDTQYEIYIDYPVSEVLGDDSFYFKEIPIYNTLLDVDKVNISKESLGDDNVNQ